MIMMSSNWQDIAKYYQNSFIKLHEFGDKLFFVNKVRPDGVIITDSDKAEGIIHLHDDHPYTITMSLPHKAMFQMDEYACILARVPARQYHRGICNDNCTIKALTSDGWNTMSLGFDTLGGYVNKPTYMSFESAVVSDFCSVALSPRFAYCVETRIIYCDFKGVGQLTGNEPHIVIHSLLVPEFTRLLQTNQYKVVPK